MRTVVNNDYTTAVSEDDASRILRIHDDPSTMTTFASYRETVDKYMYVLVYEDAAGKLEYFSSSEEFGTHGRCAVGMSFLLDYDNTRRPKETDPRQIGHKTSKGRKTNMTKALSLQGGSASSGSDDDDDDESAGRGKGQVKGRGKTLMGGEASGAPQTKKARNSSLGGGGAK